MSDAAAEARAEDELDALLAVMEPPGCSEAAAKAREKGFYRLVGLDRSGLRAYDRQAFSTLERAEEWRDRRENVSLGITWHAVLPSDVVMVDGQWSGAAQEATRYGRPLFRKESRWSPDVPPADRVRIHRVSRPAEVVDRRAVPRSARVGVRLERLGDVVGEGSPHR